MRICLITNLYPPYTRGGAERVVEVIARTLKEDGHTVRIVTSVSSWRENFRSFTRSGWLMETANGIAVYRIASANLFPYWTIGEHNILLRLFWHLFDMFAFETASLARKILRREKMDVVMTHNLKGLGFLIPRAIRRLKIRHVHTVHDVQLAVPSGLIFVGQRVSFIGVVLTQWYEHVTQWLIGSPDVVIFPSQWLQNFYEERGFFPQSKKVVLQNPIEIHGHLVIQDAHVKDVMRLLYVGQLEKHKGILFLIETFKNLQPKTYNLQPRLDIVGSGSLLSRIQKEAQHDPRIHVHGAVPHERLSDFYRNADALIVPSLVHENAPTVIFEAFAHGLPVIASRVGGIPELVKEGETGWLFSAQDAAQFTSIVQSIVKNPSLIIPLRAHIQKQKIGPRPHEYIQSLLAFLP